MLTKDNKESWMATVWKALERGRELEVCDWDDRLKDEDEVNTAMAWIREELGL